MFVDLKLDIEITCWQRLKSMVFTCRQNWFRPGKHRLFILLKPLSNSSAVAGGAPAALGGLRHLGGHFEAVPN